MRVALDGFPLSSPKTGVGHYTFELARTLAQISPDDHFKLIAPQPFAKPVVQELENLSLENLSFVNPKLTSFRRRWWAFGLPLHLRNHPVDIFHGTNYEVPLWGRGRNVVTIHDLSVLLHPEFHQPHLVKRARRRLPLMIRSAAKIIAPTESIKGEICENLRVKPERVAVTPEAPRQNFQPMKPSAAQAALQRLGIDEDFVLFVGTIEPRKNLLTLVRALDEILRKTELRPRLVIAGGEGWLMDEFYSFIEQRGLREHITFLGYTSDDDLQGLYSACRICVYPSLYEGFGLPPLEAMACGAPVITSHIPVMAETVGDAAVLVDPKDEQALAQSIVELWNDEQQRAHYSAVGLQRAAQFTWERTAQLTLDVYRQIVARNERA